MSETRKPDELTTDELYGERESLRDALAWGTWSFGRRCEKYPHLRKRLRVVEEQLELQILGEVLLY